MKSFFILNDWRIHQVYKIYKGENMKYEIYSCGKLYIREAIQNILIR